MDTKEAITNISLRTEILSLTRENDKLGKIIVKQSRALAILIELATITMKNFPEMKSLRTVLTSALDILEED